tara:strand:- start:108 stop:365 length:258 start_codon:yes stop_codon:yes gene_type:complete
MNKQLHALSKKELFLIWNLLVDKDDEIFGFPYIATSSIDDQKIKIFCYGNCDMGSKDKVAYVSKNELNELINKVSTRIDLKGVKK